ncbi:GGDEF domain-containing protein [Pseudomonas aeruginosa]|nr:GGDEF domain-containing protein [Pseudomonas aeruginosa]
MRTPRWRTRPTTTADQFLPNRAFFEGRLESWCCAMPSSTRGELAVLFIDSDRFKEINDPLGHAAGDTVLVSIPWRIRGQLRESDRVARAWRRRIPPSCSHRWRPAPTPAHRNPTTLSSPACRRDPAC